MVSVELVRMSSSKGEAALGTNGKLGEGHHDSYAKPVWLPNGLRLFLEKEDAYDRWAKVFRKK
jgi:hypothetical protein